MGKEKPSFKQQNLPAWQPILTAGTILPTFFLIGVAFVPIGIGLLMSSTSVQELIIDYTNCKSETSNQSCAHSTETIPGQYTSLKNISTSSCVCNIDFNLVEDFKKDVFVYYSLTNFYQNHRRYVKSRDDLQLLGNPQSVGSECYPFDYANDANGIRRPIAPCGAIANSLFNDTFKLYKAGPSKKENKDVSISKKGIAWLSDKNIRFQNPKPADNLALAFANTVKPPNWRKPVYELKKDPDNNGFQNEDLIVWMRTAALPTFRKLWGIIGTDSGAKDSVLTKGKYILSVNYNYPVVVFGGTKRFIISNTSWLGGKNNFLGIAYIIVGGICFLLSALFLFIHKKYGRLSAEIIQINQNTPYLT